MLTTQAKRDYSLPQSIFVLAEQHSDLVLVSSSLEHGAAEFAAAFPNRCHQVSPADANLVEFALDLAAHGYRPVVVGFPWNQAEILCTRPGAVILVGDDSFRDVAMLRDIPDMTVVVPSDAGEVHQALEAALHQTGPIYVRTSCCPEPLPLQVAPPFELGKARKLRDGFHVTIVTCGRCTAIALDAAAKLADEGISAELLEISTIKPMDTDAVMRSARKTRAVLCVEEHSIYGGLGSAVAEVLCRFCPSGMQMLGAEDGPATAENVAKRARVMTMAMDCE
jgi:transketolase